jgi:hypothetical protein
VLGRLLEAAQAVQAVAAAGGGSFGLGGAALRATGWCAAVVKGINRVWRHAESYLLGLERLNRLLNRPAKQAVVEHMNAAASSYTLTIVVHIQCQQYWWYVLRPAECGCTLQRL